MRLDQIQNSYALEVRDAPRREMNAAESDLMRQFGAQQAEAVRRAHEEIRKLGIDRDNDYTTRMHRQFINLKHGVYPIVFPPADE